MKAKIKIIILITFLLFIKEVVSHACTIISASNENIVLVGNNEDWIFPFTKVWFIPANNGEYGRITFGFDEDGYAAQGGVNTEGLFVDVNAARNPGWRPIEGLDYYRGDQDEILANCATVDEVLDLFRNKNCRRLAIGKLLIADATGKSAIIEYGKNKVEFLIKEEGYQISTSMFQSHYEKKPYPSTFYNSVDAVLRDKKDYTVDVIRSALSIASQEQNSITSYSYIGDLLNKKIYLYHFHNFEEVVVLDIAQELAKGKHEIALPSLFSFHSVAYQKFIEQSPIANFYNIMNTKNVETAIICYKYAKNVSTGINYNMTESNFNTLGYRFMREGNLPDAIKIFSLNIEEYPKSSNAYDSLAEAYMRNGQNNLAIENYKKSLELNPDNENAEEMLKRLKN